MTKFKNYDAYREYLTHWRRDMKNISSQIAELKKFTRLTADNWKVRAAMAQLRSLKMTARSIMIARQAITADYKASNTQRAQAAANPLNDGVPLAFPTDARA